ncbi:adenosylcobinamide-GDP ribazoletransferase [Rhodovulum sp. 12E13]|uniref:adenosylcobinamide-GDP ribazoletransferase n=1 Tax=Rhodovulum sp. 12E13 TaxID=2203891 RepID=UPI000E1AA689|nr:adenosylcobinamide-GDP ribazoletransferase [Rhodovulum sp. 12E13]RDC73042.1 adenosylcobinamide-GDP ribazoletransferase [Rhodovulum sp. 12E13]
MSALRRRWDEARLALMLLTRLPAGRIAHDIPLARSRWAYPLVGVPVGLIAGLLHWGALGLGASAAVAAVAALAALAAVTGGLHHDGLADFADGLGGSDRAQRLEIMRDSRIGSYGVLALGLVVAAMGAAIADLGAGVAPVAFVAIAVASRCAMLAALVFLPPARADGLGAAAHAPGGRAVATGGVIALVCLIPLGATAVPVAAAMSAAAAALAMTARRRLGGQTGDVLGAVQLASEAAGWIALSVSLSPI